MYERPRIETKRMYGIRVPEHYITQRPSSILYSSFFPAFFWWFIFEMKKFKALLRLSFVSLWISFFPRLILLIYLWVVIFGDLEADAGINISYHAGLRPIYEIRSPYNTRYTQTMLMYWSFRPLPIVFIRNVPKWIKFLSFFFALAWLITPTHRPPGRALCKQFDW